MTIRSKYQGTCGRCGRGFAAGTLINWSRGSAATHASLDVCNAAKAAPAPATVTVNLKPVADFLAAARARGLKFPNCRFLAPNGGELRLSTAGSQSKFPGAIQVKVDDNWIGRVGLDGVVAGPLSTMADVVATLTSIALDPVKAAKEFGALHCRCSFCNTALTDEGSVEVGYGPVCAKHWGLPHKPKGSKLLTAVVTESAMADAANLLDALAASLSDGDEIPAERRLALETEYSAVAAQMGL